MAFHGTDDFYVDPITERGLRTDTCLTGNYGDGAYVGVNTNTTTKKYSFFTVYSTDV